MILLALITGSIFGFLLRKATVSRFDMIVNQLLLRDFTVMKVILTAIAVGSIGIYAMDLFGVIPTYHLSTTPLMWSLVGGGIFGVGMSVAGYCPGTALTSIAEGSKDMLTGLAGMVCGAVIVNEFSTAMCPPDVSSETLTTFFHLPAGVGVGGTLLVWALFAFGMKKLEARARLTRA